MRSLINAGTQGPYAAVNYYSYPYGAARSLRIGSNQRQDPPASSSQASGGHLDRVGSRELADEIRDGLDECFRFVDKGQVVARAQFHPLLGTAI